MSSPGIKHIQWSLYILDPFRLVEIKLGGETLVSTEAGTLLKLAAKIDTTKMKPPSFLMVVVATGEYAYPRSDGVIVAPIGTLKP